MITKLVMFHRPDCEVRNKNIWKIMEWYKRNDIDVKLELISLTDGWSAGIRNNKLMKKYIDELGTDDFILGAWGDCLIAPWNIKKAIKMCEEGKILVVPFSGRWIEVKEGHRKTCSHDSVGGGSFVHVGRFIKECGGENTNIKGWGWDDWERWRRVDVLTGLAARTGGSIVHPWHPRPPESRPGEADGKVEYEKVLKMSKEELKEYIKTFEVIKYAKT